MSILSKRSVHAENPILEEDITAEMLKNRGHNVIKLNRGDPPIYFNTPDYIIDAYISALKEHKTNYTDATGIVELRNAVAKRYKRMYNINIDPNNIVTTAGVSEALEFINYGLINPGDHAIIFKPYYSAYIPRLLLAGGIPIYENYYEKENWNIDIEHLNASIKTLKRAGRLNHVKYMIITNPNNPTGTVLKKSILKDIVDIANDNNILLISDEIYDEIYYNKTKFTSIGEVAKGIPHVILNGASKDFDATGFRIGFIITPEHDKISSEFISKMADFARVRLCVNTPAQYASAAALENRKEHTKAIKYMVSEIEKRVNYAVSILNENKYIETVEPNGAFYIFPKIKHNALKIKNDREFVDKFLREEYIQLTRGSGFGKPGYFRIVSLPPKEILDYALNKLNEFCVRNKV